MKLRLGLVSLLFIVLAVLPLAQQSRQPARKPAPAPAPTPPGQVRLEAPADLQQAAREMLAEMQAAGEGWTAQSRIVAVYPLYLPGVETPSYYEFKVKTGNKDAGYILVNAGQSDILIPELATEGPALTEIYQQQLGGRKAKVFRYGWFLSAAFGDGEQKNLLASMGFLGKPGMLLCHTGGPARKQTPPAGTENLIQGIEGFHNQFGQLLQRNKTVPKYQPSAMTEFYGANRAAAGTAKGGGTVQPKPKGGGSSSSFNRLTYRFDPEWHTPAWYQPHRGDSPVGCGNTAWAIVYAYWKQFKGKNGLFGIDLTNKCFDLSGEPETAMWDIGRLTETSYGRYWSDGEWKYYGRTMPSNMVNAIEYAKTHGCPEATAEKYNAGERTKFWEVNQEITADRPVILLVNEGCGATGFGIIPYHYVVIERASHREQRGTDSYGYYVNMGHGQNPSSGFPHKWIMTVRKGLDDSAFSAYFIHMRDDSTPRPFAIAVQGLVGRDTLCMDRTRPAFTCHLENLKRDCDEGRIQIFKDGVLLDTLSGLEEMEDTTFNLRTTGRQLLLRATCGSQQTEKTIHLDFDPPTFEAADMVADTSGGSSINLAARRVQDDGYWNTQDWETHVVLDGRRELTGPGTSIRLDGLSAGSHSAVMRIKDGCGRWSATRTATFTVSARGPRVAFIAPAEGARVRRGSDLTVTVEASAEGGVQKLTIYLDRISEDEFNPTQIAYFPGVFGADRPARKNQTVRADWSRGRHTLIAVAVDNSGRTTREERSFTVE